MTNQILQNLRGTIFKAEDTIDTIDRYFQNSNSNFFINDIKKIETIITNAVYELEHIESKIENKLDEMEN